MRRAAWVVIGCVCAAGAVALGTWTWFLAGRSVDVMGRWPSMASGFATLVSLLLAAAALIIAGVGAADGRPVRDTPGVRRRRER